MRFYYLKNSKVKLVFSSLLSCTKENIIRSFIKFTSHLVEFFTNRKIVVNRINATRTEDLTTSLIERFLC